MENIQCLVKWLAQPDQKVVNAIAKGDKLNSVKIIRIGEKAKAFKGDEAHYKKLMTDKEKSKTVKFEAQMKKDAEQIEKLVADLKKKHKADMVTSKTGLRYIINSIGRRRSSRGWRQFDVTFEIQTG